MAIAEALLRHETLQKDDIDRLMKGERLDKPTVADLLDQEARKDTSTERPSPPNEETDPGLGGIMPHPA